MTTGIDSTSATLTLSASHCWIQVAEEQDRPDPPSTLGHVPPTSFEVSAMLNEQVQRLAVGLNNDEDLESTIWTLQAGLRAGDRRVADSLTRLAMSHTTGDPSEEDAWASAMAIEVLAAARAPLFGAEVLAVLKRGLASSWESVRFAAVASSAELPKASRAGLRRIIVSMAAADSSDQVRRAATAFLNL